MGINLVDLIIEATIRDGIEFLTKNPDVLDDVFSPLTKMYASRKYGQAEIEKIKNLLQTKKIAVVHSFHLAEAKSPCYSVQLGAEAEDKARAHLGDFEQDVTEYITDPEELQELIKIDNLLPTAYDPVVGKVSVQDSVDLSLIHPGYLYVDGSDEEFQVKSGMSNIPGNKFFFIDRNLTPNIAEPGHVKTFLNYTQHEVRGDTSSVNVLIGVHSKDALLTKYLYIILKYIMKSRKKDLINRGLLNSSFQGSDFTRDLRYEGDIVYTRFFTVSGQVDDTWRSDNVDLFDNVVIEATPIDCAE